MLVFMNGFNCYREEKLSKLCSVMGVEVPHDPDPTYELTTDNVKKILAIYMRFRYFHYFFLHWTDCKQFWADGDN